MVTVSAPGDRSTPNDPTAPALAVNTAHSHRAPSTPRPTWLRPAVLLPIVLAVLLVAAIAFAAGEFIGVREAEPVHPTTGRLP